MSDKLTKLCATFFYVGYIPVAPGSMASIAGALLSLIFSSNIFCYVAVFGLITIIGFLVSTRMEEIARKKDPSCVVIDEVAGSFIAFFMLPLSFSVWVTAFFLFRAFDMFKIYPTNKLEELPGAKGIMLDDLVAGVYTNIVMQITIHFSSITLLTLPTGG